MTDMEKLLAEALALPEDERARLAHALLRSLDREQIESSEQSTAA